MIARLESSPLAVFFFGCSALDDRLVCSFNSGASAGGERGFGHHQVLLSFVFAQDMLGGGARGDP